MLTETFWNGLTRYCYRFRTALDDEAGYALRDRGAEGGDWGIGEGLGRAGYADEVEHHRHHTGRNLAKSQGQL